MQDKKGGDNFLCKAVILLQYYNFEDKSKDKYPDFKQISFEQWNMITVVYFFPFSPHPITKKAT